MARYMISYIGGDQPASQEEGQKHFAKYMEWLKCLGDAAVSPANPLKDMHVIQPDGTVVEGGVTTMSGFTIIEASSMIAALALAQSCPFLELGGTLEVSEMMPMPGQK